jgi:5-methylcytosine-specific restriction endonuclease McrA
MKYSEKLRDPRWQKKRLEVMNRDNFTCLACGDSKSTLNVHHMYYNGNPWDAHIDSLETLCETCHKNRSDLNKMFMGLSTRDVLRYYRLILCDPGVESWAIQAIDICLADEDFPSYLLMRQMDGFKSEIGRRKIDESLNRGDIH